MRLSDRIAFGCVVRLPRWKFTLPSGRLFAETEGFVPERAGELELDDGVLRATVRGHRGEPRHLVKAVTLHRLLFEPEGDGWRARVVLDV